MLLADDEGPSQTARTRSLTWAFVVTIWVKVRVLFLWYGSFIFFLDEVQISINVHPDDRRKRSADEFPDDMDIDLPVEGSHVTLALHRNKRISSQVPVTVQRNGRIVYQYLKDTQVSLQPPNHGKI